MKKKLLSLFPLFALVGCSYGGITKISEEQFMEFFNRGDLKTQKDYNFELGDVVSISASGVVEGEGILVNYDLSTGSIAKWESDGQGTALSYHGLLTMAEDEDMLEVTIYNEQSGNLFFTSSIVKEEDEDTGESVVVGRSDTYNLALTAGTGDAAAREDATDFFYDQIVQTVTRYYEVLDDGETFDEDPLYVNYTQTSSSEHKVTNIYEDGKKEVSVTVLNETIDLRVYSSTRYNLGYSFYYSNQTLQSEAGVATGKIEDNIVKTTSIKKGGASEVDSGSQSNKHNVYVVQEGTYVKDEEHSSESSDDAYRYEVEDGFIDSFDVSMLLISFKQSGALDQFLGSLNGFVHGTFAEFLQFVDSDKEKEIIRFGDTYQYRAHFTDDYIYQYTFVEGEENHDRLTNYVVFEVGNKGELNEVFKCTMLY